MKLLIINENKDNIGKEKQCGECCLCCKLLTVPGISEENKFGNALLY